MLKAIKLNYEEMQNDAERVMDWNLSPTTVSPVAPSGQLADSRPHKIELIKLKAWNR